MRACLEGLSTDAVAAASAAATQRLAALPQVREAAALLVYVSKDHEIATHDLIRQWLAQGRTVAVPTFDEGQQAYRAARLVDFDRDLVPGRFGVREVAPSGAAYLPIESLQALVIPGVAFTARGDRLGRGKGCFDRILSRARGVKIGLAHECQLVPVLAALEHDIGMDLVVTDQRTRDCREERP